MKISAKAQYDKVIDEFKMLTWSPYQLPDPSTLNEYQHSFLLKKKMQQYRFRFKVVMNRFLRESIELLLIRCTSQDDPLFELKSKSMSFNDIPNMDVFTKLRFNLIQKRILMAIELFPDIIDFKLQFNEQEILRLDYAFCGMFPYEDLFRENPITENIGKIRSIHPPELVNFISLLKDRNKKTRFYTEKLYRGCDIFDKLEYFPEPSLQDKIYDMHTEIIRYHMLRTDIPEQKIEIDNRN